MRTLRSPNRWAWLAPLAIAGLLGSCDDSLQGVGPSSIWGFIIMSAEKSDVGTHFTSPEGLFFRGNLAAVPNADLSRADSCADGPYSEGGDLSGVTYLDAGASVMASVGGVTSTLERTTTSSGLSYLIAGDGSVQFTPGDSVVVTVPGASGGYPAANIRAKTAEAFTFPTVDPPGGTETIQLSWTQSADPNSAMIVSLRYSSTGSSTLNRHVLCTFVDDGVDSIPFRWHQNWSNSAGAREVVATRLRTRYVSAGTANLGVISTYEVPTPPHP